MVRYDDYHDDDHDYDDLNCFDDDHDFCGNHGYHG